MREYLSLADWNFFETKVAAEIEGEKEGKYSSLGLTLPIRSLGRETHIDQ